MKHLQFAPGELKEEFNTYAQKSILCRMDKRRPDRMVELCRLYIRNDRTRRQEHLVNALALRGEEGRSTLRKAAGRREHPLIRGYPNGATHRFMTVSFNEYIVKGSERRELKHLSTYRKGNQPRLRK